MSRKETEKQKLMNEYCQRKLTKMLQDEDNKYCVDCDAKGPRWVSWNIGIFLCIRCAGIHRNLGVHISRVKSVNLDSWTPEQVVCLEQMGNSRARAVYEANVPDNFRRPQTDSSLESFIRAKYEQKKYIAKEWVQPPPPAKVDWEKEMEEEIEKQKKKKKAATAASGGGTPVAIPAPSSDKKSTPSSKAAALPPPISKGGTFGSPKSSRTERKSASSDLLGLNTGTPEVAAVVDSGDAFANFLNSSAPTDSIAATTETSPAAKPAPPKADGFSTLDKLEADFFNQSSTASKEATAKMTKDSILALYGSAPAINPAFQAFNGSSGQFPGLPAGGYSAPPSAFAVPQAFNQFGMAPQQPQWGGAPTTWPSTGPASLNSAQAFPFPAATNSGAVSNPSNDALAKQFGSLNLNNVWQ